jgi:hypothetical protein
LERRFTVAAVIEIEARTQRQLLARECALAAAERRGEARLRLEHGASTPPSRRQQQLARLGPHSVGDLLTGSEADACDQRLMAADGDEIRVGGDEPESVQGAVEDLEPCRELGFAGAGEPCARGACVRELLVDLDHCRPACGYRLRLRLRLRLAFPALESTALGRPERRDHEHVGSRRFRRVPVGSQQVAAVGRPERPRQLELREPEQREGVGLLGRYRRIAYLLGLVGTEGSGIWLMREIRSIHCFGLRIWVICAESFLLVPKIGV